MPWSDEEEPGRAGWGLEQPGLVKVSLPSPARPRFHDSVMIFSLPRPHSAGTLLLPSLRRSSTGGAGRMRICVRKGQPKGLKSCPFPEIPSGHPCVPRASFPCPWASSQRQRGNDIIPTGWHPRHGASPTQRGLGCWAAPGHSLGCSAAARHLPPTPQFWGVLQAQPQSLWGRARTPCRICPGLVWAQGSSSAQLQPEHSQPAPGEPLELLQQLPRAPLLLLSPCPALIPTPALL